MSESLEAWILEHPNVSKAPHRFGGTEYQVQGLEFMHSHGPLYLDIRLSKEDQERVLKEEKAEHHRFAPQAGWVTLRIRSQEDIENAKEIIQLAYDHVNMKMKLTRIEDLNGKLSGPRSFEALRESAPGFHPVPKE